MNSGNSGHTYHTRRRLPAPAHDLDRFRLFAHISTRPAQTPSRFPVRHDLRGGPERAGNAYFEFDAQPARMMPYTPTEVSANTYSKPALMLDNTSVSVNGMTAHAASAGPIDNSGATKKR